MLDYHDILVVEMWRHPPEFPLFPTRRSSDLFGGGDIAYGVLDVGRRHKQAEWRSEEHTSELQSLTNIVCRLLLEKKKLRNSDFGAAMDRTPGAIPEAASAPRGSH